ncbi:ATP-binding protein [Streptomyces sp. NPDC002917]|uniref:ATP-binding protein n=1 Tax=Streptomyces sp. NPDC002917 TaxID=3364671 RepID=UPI0036BBF39C
MTQNSDCVPPTRFLRRHPGYSETLPRTPESAAAARELARTALTAWGQDELIEDALLIITELVSNAVEHGRIGPIRIIVTQPTKRFIRLGVVDRSKAIPIMRLDSNQDDVHGRGLLLVDALSHRWGTDLYRWGKQVWGELKSKAIS